METTEAAILRTILYADIFDFPLTLDEIHHFLIADHVVPRSIVERHLCESRTLRSLLVHQAPYYALAERLPIILARMKREAVAQQLYGVVKHYGGWIACLPFVRMVAITGSLAMHNPAGEHDDLDYMVITEPGRVWLTRGLIIGLVRIMRLRGVNICPNYVVASDQLEQKRQDIFIAHEITQMIPIYGLELYQKFRSANSWAQMYQGNAHHPFRREMDFQVPNKGLKTFVEWLLRGRIGDWLEFWEYRRKQVKFAPRVHKPQASAEIDTHIVKGHFEDYGHPILREYRTRLGRYGIEF